jgi:hypothetical protein
MANTKQWVIAALDCKPSIDTMTDVVSVIHWRKQATEVVDDKTYTADMYGACTVTLPEPESFIEFNDLTEATMVEWLEAVLDVAAIDSALDAQIDFQKNPPVVTKKAPWITEELAAPLEENSTIRVAE